MAASDGKLASLRRTDSGIRPAQNGGLTALSGCSMSRIAVILPAAGKSSRFGGPEKKPFVSLDGRPVWQRTAELFWSRPEVARVFLVLDPEDRDEFRDRFGHLLAFADNIELVNGGSERFESVANAIARVPVECDLIAVHDAVRPLTPPHLIQAVFSTAASTGAAMLAIPVADTLKRVDPATSTILETVPRQGLWQAQTPQVFRADWLRDAYARRAVFPASITDDAQLVEAAGHAVKVVTSVPTNFKITTADDLALAHLVLKGKPRRTEERPSVRPFDDEARW